MSTKIVFKIDYLFLVYTFIMYHNCDTIYVQVMIVKNEVIHARISEDIKKECESILSNIGIAMSQAIDLYLRQIVLKRGIPFELNEIEKETPTEELAYIINSVDGGEVPKDAKKIIHLYTKGDIDLETAKFAIGRIVARWQISIYILGLMY